MPVHRKTSRRRKPARPAAEVLERRQLLATITVNTTADDDGTAGTTTLSLRQAIELSNGTLALSALTQAQANLVVGGLSGRNTIDFDIPGAGPFTISPTSALPAITSPAVVDGYSQPGARPNTNGPRQADNAVLLIELDGAGVASPSSGLDIETSGVTIQGLAIGGFASGPSSTSGGNGITIGGPAYAPGSALIEGDFIGTDVTGMKALPNGGDGIQDDNGFSAIGGTAVGARNVISGNAGGGVSISGTFYPGNGVIGGDLVAGNFIGTDATGAGALPNGGNGVDGSVSTIIGGTAAGAGNVISGNAGDGLSLAGPYDTIAGPSTELVEGNLIGTDVTGTRPIPNEGDGIADDGYNVIGGTAAGASNVISGNLHQGLRIVGSGDLVEGNLIGTDLTGTRPLPNYNGVDLEGSSDTIGGTASGAGNVLSGNQFSGLTFGGSFNNDSSTGSDDLVEGNFIGTDRAGTGALPNGYAGVEDDGASNTFGGTSAGARNVISGNTSVGLYLNSADDLVEGNFIGTDVTGTRPLPNEGSGLSIYAGVQDTIGGTAAGARNVISGNGGDGLDLSGSDDLIQGNFVGTDLTGIRALPNNTGHANVSVGGIVLEDDVDSTIGGTAAGAGNVISGNLGDGLSLSASLELIQGNFVGTDVTGTRPLPNHGAGIEIRGGGSDTIGGTAAGAGNVIADNQGDGVSVAVSFIGIYENGGGIPILIGYYLGFNAGQSNTISGNSIFANRGSGIRLLDDHQSFLAEGNDPGTYDLVQFQPADPIGANGLLAAPSLLDEAPGGGGSAISGTLSGAPSSRSVIEVFSGPSGPGQGKTYLGSTVATTDKSGHASFIFQAGSDLDGRYLTATATDSKGDTSEFSDTLFFRPRASVALAVSPETVVTGRPVTLDATVAGPKGGSVTFLDNGLALGIVPLDPSGHASLTFTVPAGLNELTADYAGSTSYAPASSPVVRLVATRLVTTTTLVGPTSLATTGQPITFTATVSPTAAGGLTGMVAFAEADVLLSLEPVDASGVATFTTSRLAPGPHVIQAAYLGDPANALSLANDVTVGVLPTLAFGGPTVTSTAASTPDTVTIAFSRPLLVGTAQDIRNYAIVGPDGHALAIKSAVYDPTTDSVTLTTRQALKPRQAYRITVNGVRIGRVDDVYGIPLEGKHDGRPGSSFVGTVTARATPPAQPHPAGPKPSARVLKKGR